MPVPQVQNVAVPPVLVLPVGQAVHVLVVGFEQRWAVGQVHALRRKSDGLVGGRRRGAPRVPSSLLRSTVRRRSSSCSCILRSWLVGSSSMVAGTGVGEGSGASPRLSRSLLNSTSLIALVGGAAFLLLSVGRRATGASTGAAACALCTKSTNKMNRASIVPFQRASSSPRLQIKRPVGPWLGRYADKANYT